MKRKLFIVLFLVLTFGCMGCMQESVLSDVEITDPTVIRPEITFAKSKEGGSITQSIYAWINDKNNNPVELKNGGVSINGKAMPVKNMMGLPYYSGLDVVSDIRPGYTYDISIKLKTEKTYNASIKIQEKDLATLTLPASHNRFEDMNISWTEIDPNRELKLEMLNYYKNNNQETTEAFTMYIPQQNLAAGKFSIPSTYFQSTQNIFKTRITLSSKVSGTIYEGFRSGSSIESTLSISKTCQIY
ncbi:MAG TPA: hypothetical protein VHO43_13710 [Ignavibacteriales bacterium]|nr:hypothetical protein [Ignavibacteriales bacterium]